MLPGVHAGREFPFDSIEEWLTSDFGRSGGAGGAEAFRLAAIRTERAE
jgi:hypothetical protein